MSDPILKVKKIILLAGDIIILYGSLALTLYVRYWPNFDFGLFQKHLLPFSIVYTTLLLIFYIGGLYDFHLAKNGMIFYSTLFRALFVSAGVAILIFFVFPFFAIAPKTNLVLN